MWQLSLRGLRVQILLWVILPLILLLVAFSLTGIRSHQHSMRTLVAERDLGLVRALAGDVISVLDRYQAPLSFLAQSLRADPSDDLAGHLASARERLGPVTLFVVDREGTVVASVGATAHPLPYWTRPALPSELPQIIDGEEGLAILWQFPLQDGGYLVATVPLATLGLESVLAAGYPSNVGHVLLVDASGRVLAVAGAPLSDEERLITTLPLGNAEDSSVTFVPTPEGELVVAQARVPGTSWRVVVREPWEALAAPLLRFDKVMPFVLLAATVISLLTLLFGLRYVAAPLQHLREQAERIGHGDFQAASKPVGGVQEIEELRRTLDRMARQVAQYQAALEMYLKRLTRFQEEERARLARELHDGTVQALIALNQRLQMVQRELARDPEQASRRLVELRNMVGEAIEDVRRFSRTLRPLYLEELGLAPALEMLAREAGAAFHSQGRPFRLSSEEELALFRIAQEALSNAQRHAQAAHIAIFLAFESDRVRLVVQDDGIGFRLPNRVTDLVREGHLGLMNMHERAQIIGARLDVHSRPGQGTRVEVVVHLKDRQAT